MLEFREEIRRTELKLDLLEQGEKLESESKRLDADIHRLRIIAHNEQADVENIKTPGIKGLLLGITGRKQEVLEKEEAEARNAKQQYDLAVARKESVLGSLSKCTEELTSLGACEEDLWEMLSVPEDEALSVLMKCSADLPLLRQQISDLFGALTKVSQLGAIRNGTRSPLAVADTDDKLRSAERKAQNMLIQLKEDIKSYEVRLAPFGIALDNEDLQSVRDDYLTELYSYAMITSHVEKVIVVLRQIGFRMDALTPRLTQLTLDQQKKYLRTLLDASRGK